MDGYGRDYRPPINGGAVPPPGAPAHWSGAPTRARSGPGLPPPTPWAGDWGPSQDELHRWGSSATIATQSQAPGQQGPIADLLDVTLPVPMLVQVMGNLVSVGEVPWTIPVLMTLEFGVGRGSTRIQQLVGPPQNPPPPGIDLATVYIPSALVGGGFTSATLPPIPTRYVRLNARFFADPGDERVTIFAGMCMVQG